jgi:ribosomal protein S18 acetylase RimI-like enzyme
VLELWHAEVRAGRQDCVPGDSHLGRLLAGFDWGARSRMVDGARGLEGAVLVAGRPTPHGTVTQVTAACERLDLRQEMIRWGFGLSKAAGAIAAQVWCGRGHTDGLAQLGADFVRPWWRMDMSLEGPLLEPVPVPGYVLRDGTQVAPGGWADVHNRSFADHWRFSPRLEAELVTGRPPQLSLIAITEAGAPAAVTLAHIESYSEDARHQPVGLVASVGTIPEHRRRGLAKWLVAEALQRLRRKGARSSSLYVDGWNHTRAFDGYEKLGFVLSFQSEVWEAVFQ